MPLLVASAMSSIDFISHMAGQQQKQCLAKKKRLDKNIEQRHNDRPGVHSTEVSQPETVQVTGPLLLIMSPALHWSIVIAPCCLNKPYEGTTAPGMLIVVTLHRPKIWLEVKQIQFFTRLDVPLSVSFSL